jgi:hypothetical protein
VANAVGRRIKRKSVTDRYLFNSVTQKITTTYKKLIVAVIGAQETVPASGAPRNHCADISLGHWHGACSLAASVTIMARLARERIAQRFRRIGIYVAHLGTRVRSNSATRQWRRYCALGVAHRRRAGLCRRLCSVVTHRRSFR